MAFNTLVKTVKSTGSALGLGSARERLLANISSNVLYTAATIVANFLLTPFLIAHLGLAAYGMIPLVNTLTSYMAVLTTALDTSVSRFLTIDLEHRDQKFANRTFNTAFFGILGIIFGLLMIATVVSALFPVLFKVPSGAESDVSWLFITVSFGFFIAVIGGIFSVSPFVYSHFVWINTSNLLGYIVRILLTIALYLMLPAHLWYSGGATLVGSILSLIIFVNLWRKFTPELHINIRQFDWSRLAVLLGMGGWVIVNTAGAMLLSRVDLIVVNAFFGAAVTGAYGSVAQLSTLMDAMVNTISSVLRPVMLIKFSQGDIEGLKRVSIISVKLLGFALALPAGLLSGFARPILGLWLGPNYQYLSLLVIVLVSHFSFNYSVRPLLYVQNAYNKVRWPGIATLIAGVLDLILAVLAAWWGKWGYIGVAVVGVLVWTLKNSVYMPIYTARIMNFKWWIFYPSLSASVIGTIFVGLLSYGITLIKMPENIISLLFYVSCVSLVYTLLVWTIGLNVNDRAMLMDLLPIKFNKSRLV